MAGRKSQSAKKPKATARRHNELAGLVFAPSRCTRALKQGRYSKNYSPSAGVFLAGVLEYMTMELLELAGACAQEHGKQRIVPKHIQLALRNDEEL